MHTKKVLDILRKTGNEPGGLISVLEEIQKEDSYLSESSLRLVAKETGYSLADIYSVATFYRAFSLKPKGKHCLSACLGTACHVRGAQKIVEEFSQQLGIQPGETTPDNEITLETVNCLGACALGPIVVSDGHYFANVAAKEVKEIIRNTKQGTCGTGESKKQEFPIEASCPRCNRSLMDRENCLDGYPLILVAVSIKDQRGLARMSSLYGNFSRIYDHEIPEHTIVSFSCPHCRLPLLDGNRCMECGAPTASLKINEGDAVLRICTCAGCNGHLLELNSTAF